MTLAKYQGELRGVTFGIDTDTRWDTPPAGLDLPHPDSSDVSLPVHGSSGGVDRLGRRSLEIPLLINEADDTTAENTLDELKTAWAIDTDTYLDLRMATKQLRYYGRARGLDGDLQDLWQGVITGVRGHFDALDPWGYGTTVTVTTDSSSPVTLPNAGTVNTARVVLTIVGNGGTPIIVNSTDPYGGQITWRSTLANLATRTIDLKTWTTIDGSSVNKDSEISPASSFFELLPGNNTITFTGCASVAATIEPAYA